MSDDLRELFEDSLDVISVPPHSASGAAHRGRRLVRRRVVVSVLALIAFTGLSVMVGAGLIEERASTLPVGPSDEVREVIDSRVAGIVDALGPFCDGYDFYYVSEIGDGLYRPAQCGMRTSLRMLADEVAPALGSSPTPMPSPTSGPVVQKRLLRGPRVLVYSFSSSAIKELWLKDHPPFWGGRIAGDEWVVDVVYPSRFAAVRQELPAGDVVSRGTRAWRLGDYVVNPLPDRYEPEFALPRVSRVLITRPPELLAAQLGRFGEKGTPGVPAWIITFRQCVPQYGGEHASLECSLDRGHLVIDAETGRRIARFST
jgi:hypothetical protein